MDTPKHFATKMRRHLVDEAVAALNNLVIFDHGAVDYADLPAWYRDAVGQADLLVNQVQDAVEAAQSTTTPSLRRQHP